MQGIRVRPLERSDMEQVLRLHRSRDDVSNPGDAEKRTELLEWLAFHNPHANNEATYFVAEEADTILAFQGRMPMQFLVGGRTEKGYYVHDTYVHPDARNRGIGFSLITALAEATERESDSFFCIIGGTPLNLRIQRRMGYVEIPPAPQYIKLLNPKRQLQRALKLRALVALLAPMARAGLSLIDLLLLRFRAPKLNVSPIQRFDERFDLLLERIGKKLGICSYKNAAYLNWRYVDRPYKRETILAAGRNGDLSGFVVLASNPYRAESETGVIVDLAADPNDAETVSSLCRAAILFFRARNVESISCILTDPRILLPFLNEGFRKSSSGKAMLLGNLGKREDLKPSLSEITNWHISRGDSDGFMLSP